MTRLADAEITIVGGGAFGCAVAYFLARAGKRDVVLLEKDELASGTTSQAAGLVGQVRTSPARVRIAMFSVRTFRALARETGHDPDYRAVGSLRLALTPAREAEFRHMVAVSRREGLEVDFVPLREVAERFPLLDLSGVRAALWCPSDGYLQPYGLTMAYAHGARALGVRIHTRTPVLGLVCREGAVTGVRTEHGELRTETVVVAAGPWAAMLAATAGVALPIVPVRHQYFVTEPIAGVSPDLPVLRIPDLRLYARAEVNGLLVGGFEAGPESLDPRELPRDYRRFAVEPEWERLSGFGRDGVTLLPALAEGRGERDVPGLSHLHARRPLLPGPGPGDPRPRDGRRLLRPRRVGIGRPGDNGGRGHPRRGAAGGPGPGAGRALRRRRRVGRRPPRRRARVRRLLRPGAGVRRRLHRAHVVTRAIRQPPSRRR
jgi:glycine/D-amino acid oxidase-like deaminating enzyme